jgi:predicted short-subunit dehydrogenase-like oxidoreductase (DUF2520 family)
MSKIGFIGAGTTGTALAVRLSEKGYSVMAVCSRSLSSAQKLARLINDCQVYRTAQEVADIADIIFITTPDDSICEVCSKMYWREGQSVVHCSGAHSIDILEHAERLGASVGSFHPLQTFASAEQAMSNLIGSTFGIEAKEPLLSLLKEMSSSLEGEWIELKPEDKVLYHIAATFTSNYLVTLIKIALDLWGVFGISQGRASRALFPLLNGTVNNIASVGLPDCLTGSISRGDIGTVREHIEALKTKCPEMLAVYSELGKQTIPIALAKGKIDENKARDLESLFIA